MSKKAIYHDERWARIQESAPTKEGRKSQEQGMLRFLEMPHNSVWFQAPAPVQITAEQLLREAKERELEVAPKPAKVNIDDPEELADFHRLKRKDFEDNIRKNRMQIANW